MSELFPGALRRELAHRYEMMLGAAHVLGGGDEATVWRVLSDRGVLVVRLAPPWRTLEELAWVHELIAFAARAIAVAVAPLPTVDGTTVFRWGRCPVAVFPFVEGVPLDRDDPTLRQAAAGLLARLHRALPAWPGQRPRPPCGRDAPGTWPRVADPATLVDRALDAWHAAWWRTRGRHLPACPLHGDFYRRNLLCRDGGIVGLIDWDDARLGAPVQEVAWATWEFAKTTEGDGLDIARVGAFLGAYAAAGGVLPPCVEWSVPGLIRWQLREEIRQALTAAARGLPRSRADVAYTEQEIRAFHWLRDVQFLTVT